MANPKITVEVAQVGTNQVIADLGRLRQQGAGLAQQQRQGTKPAKKYKKGIDETGESSKKASTLTERLRDSTQQLTKSVQVALGPLSGVASRITALTAIMTSASLQIAATIGGLIALGSQAVAGARIFARYEQQMLRVEAAIRISGRQAEMSAQQVQDFALEMGRMTMTNASAVRSAMAFVTTFSEIASDNLSRVVEIGQDMAALTGSQLQANVQRLARVIEDPTASIERLGRAGAVFTERQKEIIEGLGEMGDSLARQDLLLSLLEDRMGGIARDEAQGLAGILDTVQENLTEFSRELGEDLAPGLRIIGNLIKSATQQTEFFAAAFRSLTAAMATALTGRVLTWLLPLIPAFGQAGVLIKSIASAATIAAGAIGFFGFETRRTIDDLDDLIEKRKELETGISTRRNMDMLPSAREAISGDARRVLQEHNEELERMEGNLKQVRKDIMWVLTANLREHLQDVQTRQESIVRLATEEVRVRAYEILQDEVGRLGDIFEETRTPVEQFINDLDRLETRAKRLDQMGERIAENVSQELGINVSVGDLRESVNRARRDLALGMVSDFEAPEILHPMQSSADRLKDIFNETRTELEETNSRREEAIRLQKLINNNAEVFKNLTGLTSDQMEEAIGRWAEQGQEGIEQVGEFAREAARRIQQSFSDFLFDPFDEGIRGMLLGFVNAMRRMVAEIASQAVLKSFFSMFSNLSGQGGIMGAIGNVAKAGTSQLEGMQHGGSFTVGGQSGIDKNLVAFRASKGERVTVTPQSQSSAGSGPVINIDARNADEGSEQRILEMAERRILPQAVVGATGQTMRHIKRKRVKFA